MFADNTMNLPAGSLVRFRAVWPGGSVEHHELPAESAIGYAAELRRLGLAICWAPVDVAPPAPMPVAQAPRRERKAADREMRRQFRELGIEV